MEHLVFRIYAPLMSWGDIAPGTHRPTLAMPTRSALLGLVASALGVDRTDDERHKALAQGLGCASRRETTGIPLSDYHTVQAPDSRGGRTWATRRDELQARIVHTILSQRDHLQDTAYTVGLWARDTGGDQIELAGIQRALDRPRYPPYIGRRACPPALPFHPQLVHAPTLREAFEKATFPNEDSAVLERLGRAGESRRVEFDDHPAPGFVATSTHPQRDEVASWSRRGFLDRPVHTSYAPRGGP